MNPYKRLLTVTACLIIQTMSVNAGANDWIDAASLTYGQDSSSSDIEAYGVGLQNRWEHTWFKDGAWYLGGYWDAGLAYMESGQEHHDKNDLLDLSLTPVFRYQRDATLSSGVTPYAEAGIGPHLLSETRLGSRTLSTSFQFGSLLGVGLGFGDNGQYELAYRFQHISNAGIKEPNDGLNLHLLRLGYSFY